MATNPDDVHLTQDQRRRLAEAADQSGLPWRELLDRAHGLCATIDGNGRTPASRETPFQIAQRLGGIGMIEDGPPDVRTNPKYMEGFGEDG